MRDYADERECHATQLTLTLRQLLEFVTNMTGYHKNTGQHDWGSAITGRSVSNTDGRIYKQESVVKFGEFDGPSLISVPSASAAMTPLMIEGDDDFPPCLRRSNSSALDVIFKRRSREQHIRKNDGDSSPPAKRECWHSIDSPVARPKSRQTLGWSPSSSRACSEEDVFGRTLPSSVELPEWPLVRDETAFAVAKHKLQTLEVDPTIICEEDLCHVALEIFLQAGPPAPVSLEHVRRFILAVSKSMGFFENPYHNWTHVVDVMQTTFAFASMTGLLDRLEPWERFALLSAALCHDMEHPGVTSAFLAQTKPQAASADKVMFKSELLEKHHALRAFEIMVDSQVDLLSSLGPDEYYQFRASVTACILATDMSRHSDFVARTAAAANSRMAAFRAGTRADGEAGSNGAARQSLRHFQRGQAVRRCTPLGAAHHRRVLLAG